MANVTFESLDLKVNQDVKNLTFNNCEIEIKKYISIQTKLQMISNVINYASFDDDNNFYNPVKVDVFLELEIIKNYTNIKFTEEEWENPVLLYDILKSSGLLNIVLETIGSIEVLGLRKSTKACIKAIYDYDHSAMGILEKLNTDYSNLNLDITALQEKLANNNALPLLKDIMSKLG